MENPGTQKTGCGTRHSIGTDWHGTPDLLSVRTADLLSMQTTNPWSVHMEDPLSVHTTDCAGNRSAVFAERRPVVYGDARSTVPADISSADEIWFLCRRQICWSWRKKSIVLAACRQRVGGFDRKHKRTPQNIGRVVCEGFITGSTILITEPPKETTTMGPRGVGVTTPAKKRRRWAESGWGPCTKNDDDGSVQGVLDTRFKTTTVTKET